MRATNLTKGPHIKLFLGCVAATGNTGLSRCEHRHHHDSPERAKHSDVSLESGDPESIEVTPLPSLMLRVFEDRGKFELEVGNESCEPFAPEISGRRIVYPVLAKDVLKVRVMDLRSKDVTVQLFLASANQVSTRLTENTLTVADNLGRVIVVDLHRNCSMRNFRI